MQLARVLSISAQPPTRVADNRAMAHRDRPPMSNQAAARYQILARQLAEARTPEEREVARLALRRLCEGLEGERPNPAATTRPRGR